MANSRFAAAAAKAEEEKIEFDERRRERDNFYNRDEDRSGPVMPQNSRFAAAAAADGDYVERGERERRAQDRTEDRGVSSGGRFGGGHDREDNNFRGGGQQGGFRGSGGDRGRNDRDYDEPPEKQRPSRVDELLKPKKPPVEENILKPPTKEHEANFLKVPDKVATKQEDNFLAPEKKETNKVEESSTKQRVALPIAEVSAESMANLLNEFASGDRLGDDLKAWCSEKTLTLPSVEKLVFHLLTEKEKLNPDPECGWADSSKYGAALLSLVEDDLLNQMQVLWAIQQYCDKLGFPKLNGESVVQSMFRAMYKFDLAEADAFTEWKEDESDVHEKGKMTAIVQTVEWFNWLESDEDEEGDDGEEEEMEE